MNNNLQKAILAAMIATAPLAASEYSFDSHSLFAIEGGVSNLSGDVSTGATSNNVQEKKFGHVGLKLGAETEDFRAFIDGRYYFADEFSTLSTAGASLQYKFNFTEPVNYFIGANAGMAHMKIKADGINPSASTTTSYIGADTGFNFHAAQNIDLELGLRYIHLNDELTQANTTYTFNSITSAYASVIFRFKMK